MLPFFDTVLMDSDTETLILSAGTIKYHEMHTHFEALNANLYSNCYKFHLTIYQSNHRQGASILISDKDNKL